VKVAIKNLKKKMLDRSQQGKKHSRWPRKQAKSTVSTPTNTEETKLLNDQQPVPTQTSIPLLLHTCQSLKYKRYLDILFGAPKSFLIISGEHTEEQLDLAWANIVTGFSDLIKTPKSNSVFELHKKIKFTESKMFFLEKALTYLKSEYDADIATAICEWGYELIEPKDDRDAYLKQIYLVEGEAKTLVVMLNQYIAEYRVLCPENESTVNHDRMKYEKEIKILSRFHGYRINTNKETCFTMAALINIFLEANKKDNGATV
jgi:hypothetical protein